MWGWLVVIPVAVLLAPAAGGEERGASPTSVFVEVGPTSDATFLEECSDAVTTFEQSTSFVLGRQGDTTQELVVEYSVVGSAQPDVDYTAVSGTATFDPGVETVSVDIEPLASDTTRLLDLTLTVSDDASYMILPPASATIDFVAPRDPVLPPPECGFGFSEAAYSRQIDVGATPDPLEVDVFLPPVSVPASPETYSIRVTEGELPPGLGLGSDGVFTGSATMTGTFDSVVEACRTRPPGTCDTASLSIIVSPGAAPPVPDPPTFTG